MTKASAARKLAAAAAYGGGGLSALGVTLYGVLRAEARLARNTIGEASKDRPPDSTGWYGRGRPGPAIRLALIGDSSAAGYGAAWVEQTPGALLASGLAVQADRRVHMQEVAVVGARSSDLEAQVARVLPMGIDVAVILVGANDVTHQVWPNASVRYLAEAVRTLVQRDVAVVVGTCPDLGSIKPIAPPLKQVARSWSRRLAAAQTVAVVEAGGRTVSLGSILGPHFAAHPAVFFGPDQFHPSADGYRSLVRVLLPSVLAAAGLPEEEETAERRPRREAVMPVSTAAVQAAREPGTEVDGTTVGGSSRGLRGRWVELRRRGGQLAAAAESPAESEEPVR